MKGNPEEMAENEFEEGNMVIGRIQERELNEG